MTQELNPTPWGSQDRFQAHFIVRNGDNIPEEDFIVRANLKTSGFFASKKVSGVQWIGGVLAAALNSDNELQTMMTKLPYHDAEICIEPTKGGVRIHGKWKDSYNFTMTKELFAVYDRIASHVKRESGSPPVKS
jgi:hypothetical protein